MPKMHDRISDGPESPDDVDFAEYAQDHEDRAVDQYLQDRADERAGIRLQTSLMLEHLSKHNTFDKTDLVALLKRVSRYMEDE